MPRHIGFTCYETPLSPCGGVAAVMGRLPAAVAAATGEPTWVISPYHHRLPTQRSMPCDPLSDVWVPFDGQMIRVRALLRRSEDGVRWVFLEPAAPWFFAGARHPYDLSGPDLRRDALFFGAAAARVLQALAPFEPWVLLHQDWEAATTALALAGLEVPHRQLVVLHNSYDDWPSGEELWRCGIGDLPGASVLERALGVVGRPVFSVSRQFARELTEDPLQSVAVAPHLQWILRDPPVEGVDNGPFVRVDQAESGLARYREGGWEALRAWKAERRRLALAALDGCVPSDEAPLWGDRTRLRRDDAPWFVMAGRDDPRQKGYDVMAGAVRRALARNPGRVFLFFPIPGDEGRDGLRFLADLAWDHPENVLVLPFLWREGYMAAVQGAAFGVMPSLYEPFGAANEIALSGTPCVARATGGLVEQIVPLRAVPSFNREVAERADRYHPPGAHPTGILYREYDGAGGQEWAELLGQAYGRGDHRPNRPEARAGSGLWQGMVDALAQAIDDAANLYRDDGPRYARLVVAGVDHVRSRFSWDAAAQEYIRRFA